MIKQPYCSKVVRDYPANSIVGLEVEDISGFQDTVNMIQHPKLAVSVGKKYSYCTIDGNYIRGFQTWDPIKAGQTVREWYLWKFVLPSEGDPPIEVPYSSFWDDTTYADRVRMYPITQRPRTGWQIKHLEYPATEGRTIRRLIRQYVYGPMPKGFWCFRFHGYTTAVCTGHVYSMIRSRLIRYFTTVVSATVYRVVRPDGTERQMIHWVFGDYRWGFSWAAHLFAGIDVWPTFGTEDGDYLVYEVGIQHWGGGAIVEIEFGDFADDFLQYPPHLEPRSLNPFLTVWSAPDLYHTGEGQGDFWLPRRRPCRFVSIGDPVDWPEPSSQGNTAGLNEVAFGEYV